MQAGASGLVFTVVPPGRTYVAPGKTGRLGSGTPIEAVPGVYVLIKVGSIRCDADTKFKNMCWLEILQMLNQVNYFQYFFYISFLVINTSFKILTGII